MVSEAFLDSVGIALETGRISHDLYGRILALVDENTKLRYERDLFAEQVSNPVQLLNLFMDTKGVERGTHLVWGREELPACIVIPEELSRAVFGSPVSDSGHVRTQEEGA